MKAIEAELDRLRRRSAVKQQKLSDLVDTLIQDVKKTVDDLKAPHPEAQTETTSDTKNSQTAERKSEAADPKKEIKQIIRTQCEKTAIQKPLTAIKNHHKEYFTYISKLGKTIDKGSLPNCNDMSYDFEGVKRDFCSLVQDHIKETQLVVSQERGMTNCLQKYQELESLLYEKKIEEALEVYQANQQALKLVDSEFKLNMCKLIFLSLARSGKKGQAIIFLRKYMSSMNLQQAEEMGEMVHSLCYSSEAELPARLEVPTDFDSILTKCILLLRRAIRKLKGLPETSTFSQVFTAGLIAITEYSQHKHLWRDMRNKKELHVIVDLPKSMVHHSVLYCPISKDICDRKLNAPLLQNCGHIVGQASVRKMLDASRERRPSSSSLFKCPTCPNQQSQMSMRTVLY